MRKLSPLTWVRRLFQIPNDVRGQDMIEYALMAATVAVGSGAILPPVSSSISTIFSKINSIVQQMP